MKEKDKAENKFFNVWTFLAKAADPKSKEAKVLEKVNKEWDEKLAKENK